MDRPERARRWAVIALLLVSLATRLFVALRPLAFVDGLVIPDDAYLSLTLARNVAAGHGPLYGDHVTNGFQPLFVFLMTPVYWLCADPVAPVHCALVLGAVADTVALALVALILTRATKHFGAVVAAMLAWIVNPFLIQNAVNGLETSLSYCLVLAVAVCFAWARERDDAASRFRFGLVAGMAMFARVDNALLLVVAMCLLWRPAATLRSNVRSAAATAFGAAAVNAPWWLYSWIRCGSVYPVSGRAVRHMSLSNVGHAPTWDNWYWPEIQKAASAVWQMTRPEVYVAVLALGVCLAAGRRGAADATRALVSQRLLLLTSALWFLAYSLYVFADWFFPRYLAPVGVVVVIVMGLLVDAALRSLARPAARTTLVAIVLAGLATLHMRQPYLAPLFVSTDATSQGYMNLGLWAKTRFPPGTVVGASQTGALGYFADELRVVNLDGVVSEPCYRSLVEKRNIEFIRASGVEYVVGWPANIEFIRRESATFHEGDLVPLGPVPGFTSWGQTWFLYRVARPR